MKKAMVGLALMLVSAVSQAADFSVIRQYVFPIMVVSEIDKKKNEAAIVSTGSVVILSPRYALTAAHVLDNKHKAIFIVKDRPIKINMVKVDKEKDLALVEGDFGCPCATIGDVAPGLDQEIVIVGYPLYTSYGVQMVTRGHVQGLHMKRLITTAETTFGGSGGGLFTKQGNTYVLVGIVEGVGASPIGPPIVQLQQQHNWISFSVPVDAIREFVRGTPAQQ